jgi:UDP-2-acetamido-3-amino-2,3-dideoxy-glucuronate N-acetyltransferase
MYKVSEYFIHESSYIDMPCSIGRGTKIWHFCHIMNDSIIGDNCNLGQNINVASGVAIGNNVKIQNNVSIYAGTVVEDDVFLGPSCVLTNVSNPRSQINRHGLYEKTLIRRGATIGANATIVCGVTIGRYAFIAAGCVITRDVPDYAFMVGVPGRQRGWMSRHGIPLPPPGVDAVMRCAESGLSYKFRNDGTVFCTDLDEETPLPDNLKTGSRQYRDVTKEIN